MRVWQLTWFSYFYCTYHFKIMVMTDSLTPGLSEFYKSYMIFRTFALKINIKHLGKVIVIYLARVLK